MKSLALAILCSLLSVYYWSAIAYGQGDPAFPGVWELIPNQSTDIDHFGALSFELRQDDDRLTILQTWGSWRGYRDSLVLTPGGAPVDISVSNWVFPSNVFMGLMMVVGERRQVSARWESEGTVLRIDERCIVRGSQGKVPVSTIHRYELSPEKDILVYRVERSTRKSGPEVK